MGEGLKEVNNVFIIGAGFTKAAFDEAPLNDDLLPLLQTMKASKEPLFQRLVEEYEGINIEILLTRMDAQIIAGENSALKSLRETIDTDLAQACERFRFSKYPGSKKSWPYCFARTVLGRSDLVLSLNYDCFLEGALWKAGVWSPNGGYGEYVHNFVTEFSLPRNRDLSNVLLYKLHGSENFLAAEVPGAPGQESITASVNEEIFPGSHCYSKPAKAKGARILGPSYLKNPPAELELMWSSAIQLLTYAKRIYIIGCSLRAEDSQLRQLLRTFSYEGAPSRRPFAGAIIIVDLNADCVRTMLEERILPKHFQGRPDILAHSMGVEDYVRRRASREIWF